LTIRATILGLNPTVYWPLNDTSGPNALDASGNGHNGVYQANTIFGVQGPELNTFSIGASAADAGALLTPTNPITMVHACTMVAWLGSQAWVGSGDQTYLHIGEKASNGLGLIVDTGGVIQILYGGIALQSTGISPSHASWHMVGMSFDGIGTQHVFVDNTTPVVIGPGRTPAASTSAQPLVASTPGTFYIAHAAFWNSELTPAQVQSIFTGASTLNGAPFASGAAATNIDTAALSAKLDQILASVRKTY
jgi:hypothetical protein